MDWANDATVLAQETLLAPALGFTLGTLLHANTALDATANAAHDIPSALHCAVAAFEASTANAFPSISAPWRAGSIARADTALVVLRARCLTLATQVALLAFAEGDLLHFVVET